MTGSSACADDDITLQAVMAGLVPAIHVFDGTN